MQTKLHINLNQGLIEVEGDENFVRTVFDYFKQDLKGSLNSDATDIGSANSTPTDGTPNKPANKKKKISARSNKSSAKATTTKSKRNNKPPINKALKTGGLNKFLARFAPTNNGERIAVFHHFIESELKKETSTDSDLYTCFVDATGVGVPEAFGQLITESVGQRYGYLDETEDGEFSLSARGRNKLDQLKQKVAEAKSGTADS